MYNYVSRKKEKKELFRAWTIAAVMKMENNRRKENIERTWRSIA